MEEVPFYLKQMYDLVQVLENDLLYQTELCSDEQLLQYSHLVDQQVIRIKLMEMVYMCLEPEYEYSE